MKVQRGVLKARKAILLAGTILGATVPVSGVLAADVAVPVYKSVPEAMDWYFYGGFEAGGRAVVDRPPSGFGFTDHSANNFCDSPPISKCFLTASQTQSRAKFEEYGEVPTAPFLDWINLQGGTIDGRYAFDFWGKSVGLNNQSYYLDVSKIGEHYVTLGWDEIPHQISTSAKTVFGGVGSTFLTVDPTLRAALNPLLPNATATGAVGDATRNAIESLINNAEHPLSLATKRDRAIAAWFWTPTPDIDAWVNYTHEDREGTRPVGIPYGWGTSPSPRPTNPVEAIQPLDDTTQNVEAAGEYVGTTFFGTRWSTNVVYNGSFYDDHLKQLDVQNPFCFNCNPLTGLPKVVAPIGPPFGPFFNFGPDLLRLGLYPDNQANAVTWNSAVNFPFWRARYVSTLQFNDMRQNDSFVNTGTNGLVAPPVLLNGHPVSSLNGQVDTFLWNNQLYLHPTNEFQVVARGRHYDVDNDTPSLHIDNWIFGDSGCAAGPPDPVTGRCSPTNARNSLPISYTKDNASVEANWNPVRPLTFGGAWYWEQWDRKFRDANVTDENTGKVYVDYTPVEYVHARGSYSFGERRYGTYDTELFVKTFALQDSEVASNMRRFDLANRNRQKADFQVDLTPGTIVTVTPNAGLRWDDYPDGVFNPLGIRNDHSWNAGVEVAASFDPRVRILASYNYENRRLDLRGGSGGANFDGVPLGCPTANNPDNILGPLCTWESQIDQKYHTFMVASDLKVVPNTIDLRLEYLYVRSSEATNTIPCPAPTPAGFSCNGLVNGVNPASVNFGQFPTEHNNFQRFNVIAKYYVDPSFIRQMGWVGDVTIKARYTWEQNQNTNWADDITPYIATADPGQPEMTGGGRSLFLAAFNPNYRAQIVALALQVKW
jgi:MtrB/PioB family decaheme-associated outer membrane protein